MIFCPIPWNHASIKGDGSVRICCHSNHSDTKGNVGVDFTSDLSKILNTDTHKEVRLSMLKNEWHPVCSRCKVDEEAGFKSRRHWELEDWPSFSFEEMRDVTASDGSIDLLPVYYDLRLGNHCNLRCAMCGPTDSNKWFDDYVTVYGSTQYTDNIGKINLKYKNNHWQPENSPYDWCLEDSFWNSFQKTPLKKIILAGGEPMLIEQHFELLQRLVDDNKSHDIDLEYITNGTILPDKLFDIWKKFRKVFVIVSVDGTEKVTEWIRFPSKWSNVYSNLQKLNSWCGELKNVKANIGTSVQIYNAYDLVPWLEWWNDCDLNNLRKRTGGKYNINCHMVHNPKWLNIQNFPKQNKQELTCLWENVSDPLMKKFLNKIHTYMNQNQLEILQDYYKFNEKLEQIRKAKSPLDGII